MFVKRNLYLIAICFKLLPFCSLVVFEQYLKDKTIDGDAYKSIQVDLEGRCVANCLYDLKCVSFDVDIADSTSLKCNFYNASVLGNGLISRIGRKYFSKQMTSCADWFRADVTKDSVYKVVSLNRFKRSERCIMGYGGGWTVVMRRYDGSVKFFDRKWYDFKHGFGSVNTEFWLGLEMIHQITSSERYDAMVIGKSFGGEIQTQYATGFKIEGEMNKYTVRILEEGPGNYSYFSTFKDLPFSTIDNNNDNWNQNCAKSFGAWWHRKCHKTAMFGKYPTQGERVSRGNGIIWYTWFDTHDKSLKECTLMIRPSSFR